MTTCADCGKVIVRHGTRRDGTGKWAHQFGKAWVFTCRFAMAGGRMASADYHHPANEEQAHFVGPARRSSP